MKKGFQRTIALALSGIIALSITACGKSNVTESTQSTADSTTENSGEESTTPVLYESAYESKTEAVQAGLDLNEAISEEGMILLKNEEAALPLTSGAKVTLLGYEVIDPNAGSSKNGGDASAGAARCNDDPA